MTTVKGGRSDHMREGGVPIVGMNHREGRGMTTVGMNHSEGGRGSYSESEYCCANNRRVSMAEENSFAACMTSRRCVGTSSHHLSKLSGHDNCKHCNNITETAHPTCLLNIRAVSHDSSHDSTHDSSHDSTHNT